LLKASGYKDGDVNDEHTGFSPYPGNINQILFRLSGYLLALDDTKGIMPEFVNPKYADEQKSTFKKPTRLECMMQDFPIVLKGENSKKVGFTSVPADLCFSPVKNSTSEGVALQEAGTHPATAATGEADQYGAYRKMMKAIGCQVEEADATTYRGIKVIPGPQIVLKPNFVCCPGEYKNKFPKPEYIRISPNSTLIVRGSGVVIESLKLDGCLVIDVDDGEKIRIKGEVVKNEGWIRVKDENSKDEIIKMRGYRIERKDGKWIELRSSSGVCCMM
jgi:UDP-sugar pyrophosphorylase